VTAVRSVGWRVQPSFTPNGPTNPVTLLLDEHTLTQLAGTDEVAWQTPWSAFRSLRLVRGIGVTALRADIDGRTFVWRTRQRGAFTSLAPFIRAAGGDVRRDRSQLTALVVVALVGLASYAGVLGARLSSPSLPAAEKAVTAVNVTFADLPGQWTNKDSSPLSALTGVPGEVYKATITSTTVPASSPFAMAASAFESCMHDTSATDRMFGAAGQQPAYQVSSPVYSSTIDGGVQVASSAQYYATTAMVAADTQQMARRNFGACYVDANADLVVSSVLASPRVTAGKNLLVTTFAKGFRVAGQVALDGVTSASGTTEQLVLVVMTSGHYEVTLMVLAPSYRAVTPLVASLASTLLARIGPASGTAI